MPWGCHRPRFGLKWVGLCLGREVQTSGRTSSSSSGYSNFFGDPSLPTVTPFSMSIFLVFLSFLSPLFPLNPFMSYFGSTRSETPRSERLRKPDILSSFLDGVRRVSNVEIYPWCVKVSGIVFVG